MSQVILKQLGISTPQAAIRLPQRVEDFLKMVVWRVLYSCFQGK